MHQELIRRPLVIAFLGLVTGASGFINKSCFLFLVPIALFLAWPWIRATKAGRYLFEGTAAVSFSPAHLRQGLIALVAPAALGWALFPRVVTKPVVSEGFYEGAVDVVTMPVATGGGVRCVVATEGARYSMSAARESKIVLGDRLWIRAEVVPFREGQVGSRLAVGAMRTISAPRVLKRGSPLWSAGLWVSASFQRMTSQFARPGSAALLDAMCFNVTSDVSREVMDAMSKTGTLHIVSTSGLHLVLVAAALTGLLAGLPLPRPVQLALLFLFLLVYAAAAGFRPPVVRAVMMTAAFLSAYLWRRGPDGLSALALAGSVSVLFAPEVVQDIGFQLSMVAVASLVMFGSLNVSEDAHPIVRYGVLYAWTSVVVFLGTAPLIAYHFGIVSLVSVPANLLILPVLSLILGGALAAWTTWLVVPAYGIGMLKVFVEPLTGWVGASVTAVGDMPLSSLAVGEFSAWWLAAFYGVVCLAWRPIVRAA